MTNIEGKIFPGLYQQPESPPPPSAEVDWSIPGNDEAAKNGIRRMLLDEYGLTETHSRNHLNGDLAAGVSVAAFRKFGLLGMLHTKYEGDISRAIRSVLSKPLLSLDQFRPSDPLQRAWSRREEEVESEILSTMVKREREFNIYFKDRIIGNQEAQRANGSRDRKHVRKNMLRDNTMVKIPYDNWWEQENTALQTVLNRFIATGDTAISFLSGHDAIVPSLILGRAGQRGQVYVITPGPYLREGLYTSFERTLMNLQSIKGEGNAKKTGAQRKRERLERKLTGSGLINGDLRRKAQTVLSKPYQYDEGFYKTGFDQSSSGLRDGFFDDFHIFPLRYFPPHLPKQITPKSVNVIVEANRFGEIAETDKEEALYELDRVLKTGGYLIIRENARQQANIEYYAQELFSHRYHQIDLRWIKSAQILVFRKIQTAATTPTALNDYSHYEAPTAIITPNDGTDENSTQIEPLDKDDFQREVYLTVGEIIQKKQSGELANDVSTIDTLKKTLSLKWFKQRGLLAILVGEFEADIDKALRFVLSRTKKAPIDIEETILPDKNKPEDSKPYYTIADIVGELGTTPSEVRTALKRIGLTSPKKRGFSAKSVKATRLQFSPQEYRVVLGMLRGEIKHS